MKDFGLRFDYFSPSPSLYIASKPKYSTCLGVLISIAAFGAIIGFMIYFFISFLTGQELFITTSKVTNFDNSMDLSERIFFYRLMFSNQSEVPHNIAHIRTFYFNQTEEEFNSEELPVTYCDRDVHYPGSEYDIISFNISTYTCIQKGKKFKMQNKISPIYQSLYLNMYIIQCNNETSSIECASEELIKEAFESDDMYVDLVMESTSVEHQDKKAPIKKSFSRIQYSLAADFFYCYYFYFRKLIYSSDDGSLFESYNRYESYTFNSREALIEIYAKGHEFGIPGTKMIMQFDLYDDYADQYDRTYSKFQSFLANVGGIANFIMIIAKVFETFFTRKLMYEYIVNESNKAKILFEPILKMAQKRKPTFQSSSVLTYEPQKNFANSNINFLTKVDQPKITLKREFKNDYKSVGICNSILSQICFWSKDKKYRFLKECERK